ncbi:hypothetical protein GMES_0595 [Paraglaciecola mesophila KMM 241]|uniref:Uncharacterized protein n=1 Tax=Paraglaciecola mesophila KMM 241 TaxID=1128912 RepID=K6YG15_9ALTE|nr:hypothetical protein GMES_0595 [Paraglaciecola mesophila KMM 241]
MSSARDQSIEWLFLARLNIINIVWLVLFSMKITPTNKKNLLSSI